MEAPDHVDVIELDSTTSLSLSRRPGVYRPEAYGQFLAQCVWRNASGRTACDLTCGSGLHAIALARKGFDVTAIDLSLEATRATASNARSNGVSLADVRRGNSYEVVGTDQRFDILVAWPPVMPTPLQNADRNQDGNHDWWAAANSGGADGRVVYDMIVRGAQSHLNLHGSLMTLHPWYFDRQRTETVAQLAGLEARWGQVERFPMGSISGSRLPYIRELGFEPLDEGGQLIQLMQFVTFALPG